MKIMIVCSSSFYDKIPVIQQKLLDFGYEVILPNCYDDFVSHEDYETKTKEEYVEFFKKMYLESREKISKTDAVLVMNETKEKNGIELKNYIGASTFLEMYEAFMQNKQIYLLHEIPDNLLTDEIKGFDPVLLHGDIENIKR